MTSDGESGQDEIEAEDIAKSKTKGFRKTSPQSDPVINNQCSVCRKIFNTVSKLNKHMLSHDKDGDWTCGEFECSYQTISEANLKEHKVRAHNNPDVQSAAEVSSKRPSKQSSTKDVIGNSNECNICKKKISFTKLISTSTLEKHTNHTRYVGT